MISVHLGSPKPGAAPVATARRCSSGWYADLDLGVGVSMYSPGTGVETIAYLCQLAEQCREAADAIAQGMSEERAAAEPFIGKVRAASEVQA